MIELLFDKDISRDQNVNVNGRICFWEILAGQRALLLLLLWLQWPAEPHMRFVISGRTKMASQLDSKRLEEFVTVFVYQLLNCRVTRLVNERQAVSEHDKDRNPHQDLAKEQEYKNGREHE